MVKDIFWVHRRSFPLYITPLKPAFLLAWDVHKLQWADDSFGWVIKKKIPDSSFWESQLSCCCWILYVYTPEKDECKGQWPPGPLLPLPFTQDPLGRTYPNHCDCIFHNYDAADKLCPKTDAITESADESNTQLLTLWPYQTESCMHGHVISFMTTTCSRSVTSCEY